MGWLKAKGRPQPLEVATFAQTTVIVRDILRTHPGVSDSDLTDLSKAEHLRLRFQYDPQQIHKAIDALIDPARRRRSN